MYDDGWKTLVAKAAAELIQPLVNLEDNYQTVNIIFKFWKEFVVNNANLDERAINEWLALKTGDEKALHIARIMPEIRLEKFWAEAMKQAISLRCPKNTTEEQ